LAAKLFDPIEEGDMLPLVEEARGGTLVLEDIEALPGTLQARLLQFINDQGSPAETRIIAICNTQEQDKTCEDLIRGDLFYRLAAMKITIPPMKGGVRVAAPFSHFVSIWGPLHHVTAKLVPVGIQCFEVAVTVFLFVGVNCAL